MPDSDETFRCPDCDKVYKTRTSLTRHARNHAPGAAKHYTCETCGVVFARRDILNRHVVNGHCGKQRPDGKGAGRCHTACESCRRSRVRCDGEDPCKACVERRKECKYPKTTGRVSEKLTRMGKSMRNGIDGGDSENGDDRQSTKMSHADSITTMDGTDIIKATVRAIPAMEGESRGPHDLSAYGTVAKPELSVARHDHPQCDSITPGEQYRRSRAHNSSIDPVCEAASMPMEEIKHASRGDDTFRLLMNGGNDQGTPTTSLEQQELHGLHHSLSSQCHTDQDTNGKYVTLGGEIKPMINPKHFMPQNHFNTIKLHVANDSTGLVQQPITYIKTTSSTGSPGGMELTQTGVYEKYQTGTPLDQHLSMAESEEQAEGTESLATGTRHGLIHPLETGHEKPLETNPEVNHVPWPWLHERTYMRTKPKNRNKGTANLQLEPTRDRNSLTPESLGSPSEMNAGYRETITPLANVIESLVAYAANTAFSPDSRTTRRHYWETTSIHLNDIFHAHGARAVSEPKATLYDFAQAFLDNFNVLWPLLGFEQLDTDTNHPVLFLVVTSIGAMFMPSLQRQYGALMHVRLRRLLCASLYDLEGPSDDEMIWLAQARVLTQIASLYFGQHQGFSYSQHLAAITIAQMRRMDFFREPIPDITSHVWRPPEAELARWQYAETRRRLALGILRTDAYNSVLLSTRPLLTSEEVKLTFPRSDRLWLSKHSKDLQGQLQARRAADEATLPMPLSDLVRIFLDREEAKPDLSTVGYELSLFGLQEWVWRFSHDTELYVRLTGKCLDGKKIEVPRTLPPREMKELRSDYSRLTHALDAWYHGLNRAIARGDFDDHRSTLICCQLLYRLTKLRMCSPLEDLHHVSYRAADTPTIDANIFRKVHAWMRSPFAVEGAKQAWDIKSLIEDELRRPPTDKARFNFLAFCSLHHSAVVLWTFGGLHQVRSEGDASSPSDGDVEAFIKDCPNMFSQLSALGGLSFEAAARRLQDYRFPQYLPQYHQAIR